MDCLEASKVLKLGGDFLPLGKSSEAVGLVVWWFGRLPVGRGGVRPCREGGGACGFLGGLAQRGAGGGEVVDGMLLLRLGQILIKLSPG